MDPQSCTAILLKQAEDPFYILDNEEEKDLTVNLLSTMFGHGRYKLYFFFITCI
jgi:hypothetical protein